MTIPKRRLSAMRFSTLYATRCSSAILLVLVATTMVTAQARNSLPRTNYLQRADLPPGHVGQAQLLRTAEFRGYFQPVALIVPGGAQVAVAQPGGFSAPVRQRLTVGLQIGQVYRFQVSNIQLYEGREVFPSVEVINRLHPPRGQELRFPIPVEITDEELALALNGAFITRVIYLETPDLAAPIAKLPGDPQLTQIGGKDDALEVADRLGRPMAIVRIGSRIPELDSDGRFTFHTPGLLQYGDEAPAPARPDMAGRDPARVGLEEGIRGRVFPRLPDTVGPRFQLANPPTQPQRILR